MSKSNQRKSDILGMPFGTACNKLRRMVMFSLLVRYRENVCFKCGKLILKADDLSLEHEAWQSAGASLFWDLDNITFSHVRCNLPTGIVRREIVDGTLWCSSCKSLHPIALFHKETRQRTGYALLCKKCSNAKRKKVKAQGDCRYCGALRGTRNFRIGHNICLECHTNQSKDRSSKKLKLERHQMR